MLKGGGEKPTTKKKKRGVREEQLEGRNNY